MNDTQFSYLMGKMNYKSASVFMQQCYSGGFINELAELDNTLIMTSARGDELAWRGAYRDGDGWNDTHGDFDYRFMAAQSGHNPDGTDYDYTVDTNADGIISMDEVYANVESTMYSSSPQYSDEWGIGQYDWSLGLTSAAALANDIAAVPAPGAMVLAGFGASIVGWFRKKRLIG